MSYCMNEGKSYLKLKLWSVLGTFAGACPSNCSQTRHTRHPAEDQRRKRIHLKLWQDGQYENFNAPILAVKRLRQLDKAAIFDWILAFKNNLTVEADHGDSSLPCMARAGRIFQIDVVCEWLRLGRVHCAQWVFIYRHQALLWVVQYNLIIDAGLIIIFWPIHCLHEVRYREGDCENTFHSLLLH